MEMNTPFFESKSCVIGNKHQSKKKRLLNNNKKDGTGRIAIHRLFPEILHCYTIECSCNMKVTNYRQIYKLKKPMHLNNNL